MRRAHWLLRPAFVTMMVWGSPAFAGGLSNIEEYGGYQFNFNNPGARALGMGGAFISVADDATAAVTNPAGLVILQRPEISAEAKVTRFTNTVKTFFPDGSLHDRNFRDDVTTPSFFSFVFPTEQVAIAAFLREQVNFKSNFQIIRFDPFDPSKRLFPVTLVQIRV